MSCVVVQVPISIVASRLQAPFGKLVWLSAQLVADRTCVGLFGQVLSRLARISSHRRSLPCKPLAEWATIIQWIAVKSQPSCS